LNNIVKSILIILGTLSIGAGILGIFLPLIPTTPFILLGAACYFKGSQKLYSKLVGNKLLGAYIKNYREGKGIPLKIKIYAILFLWISIGYSTIFKTHNISIKIILLVIAIVVTSHIMLLKSTIKTELEDD
jgi:uncharacterized protein